MNFDQLDKYIRAKSAVTFDYPFDDKVLVYRIFGKIFALTVNKSPLEINLKCDRIYALELRDIFQSVRAGYHMNKKHWNTITLTNSDLSDDDIKELIDHSYDLIFKNLTKKQQKQILTY